MIPFEISRTQRRFPGGGRAEEQNQLRRALACLEERADIHSAVRLDGLEIDVRIGLRESSQRGNGGSQKHGLRSVEADAAVVGEVEIGHPQLGWR